MPAAKRTVSWRLLERLRYRSHSGRVIRRHRALRKLDFQRASIVHPLTVLTISYALLVLLCTTITESWHATLNYWLPHLGIQASIALREQQLMGLTLYEVPYPRLVGTAPDLRTILVTSGLCAVAMIGAALFSRRNTLPLGYLVWGGSLVVLLSCLSFFLAPQLFTHTIATHVATGLEFVLILIFAVPLILVFAFYVFDHTLVEKLAGTILITGVLVVVAPYQYLIHITLIESFSLVVMPLLQVLFGLLFDIAVFVALYAWAVSWEP